MREILFRGKGFDGEWYEGSLLITTHEKPSETLVCYRIEDTTYGYDSDYTFDNTYMSGCEAAVIPDTIGQYTGRTDKNGKQIFEGDIVTGLFLFGMPVNAVVTFQDGAFGLEWYRGNAKTFNAFTSICNVEYEVIGNIHDNPELLKGE